MVFTAQATRNGRGEGPERVLEIFPLGGAGISQRSVFKEIIDGRPGPKTSQKRFGPIRYPDIFGDLKYMIRILLLGFTYDESRVNGCGMYETRE